jgi:hypothetical protein
MSLNETSTLIAESRKIVEAAWVYQGMVAMKFQNTQRKNGFWNHQKQKFKA